MPSLLLSGPAAPWHDVPHADVRMVPGDSCGHPWLCREHRRRGVSSSDTAQPSGTPQDARLLDHFVVGELFASQVELGPVGQEIPVVHALAAAIAANDLSNQQFAFAGSLSVATGYHGKRVVGRGSSAD